MTDAAANAGKGQVVNFYSQVKAGTNEAFIVTLLQGVGEDDDDLIDHASLQALLAVSGNNVADFTNYAEVVLKAADIAALPSFNTSTNSRDLDLPDMVWSSAGGTLNNTLVKLIISYDPDSSLPNDANRVPLAQYDFNTTTAGGNLTALVNASGFYKAS